MRNIRYIGTANPCKAFHLQTGIIWIPNMVDTVLDEDVAKKMLKHPEFQDAGDSVGASRQSLASDPVAALSERVTAGISQSLIRARQAAIEANPWETPQIAVPPTITVGAAALTNPVTYGYAANTGKIRILGVPTADTSLMVTNNGGYWAGRNVSAAGPAYSEHVRGGYVARDTNTATGAAGPSRYITGDDAVHLASPYGCYYMAQWHIGARNAAVQAAGW